MSTPSISQQKTSDDIKEYGWHVIKVLENDDEPGYGYSIGFYKTFSHPEILIVGLKLDLIHSLINNIGEEIKKGKTFNSQTFYDDVLDGYNCYFASVDKRFYDQFVGQAQGFYNSNEFPLLQCIYPTVKGIYPWEDNWPENIKNLQPILCTINL